MTEEQAVSKWESGQSYSDITLLPRLAAYFRVTVGNCLTLEEAIILKGRVSGTFPKAFPKSEPLSLRDFRY